MDQQFKTVLAKAVITVLRPLLRVLIRNEVSHAEFAELARQAYVEVAYENFSIEGRKTTYSRVAVLTGLSRKEVVRLHKLLNSEEPVIRSTPNRAIRVINGWLQDEEFLDADGKPKVLPLQGQNKSFAALVARYSGDITLGAVVDELERVGVVHRPNKNTVRLNALGYIPHEDELEKIRILSECAADLLDTAVHNLDADEDDARFQRQMIYPQVPQEVLEDFKRYSSDKSSQLLQDFNRFLTDKIQQSAEQDNTSSDTHTNSIHKKQEYRIGFGMYYVENITQKERTNEDRDVE